MPIYPYRCNNASCGHSGEAFETIARRGRIRCSRCGGRVTRVPARLRNANREFHGEREATSLVHGCHPDDAAYLNSEYGCDNFQPDGTVKFRDRADERRFREKKAAYEARTRQQAADHWKGRPAPERVDAHGNPADLDEAIPVDGDVRRPDEGAPATHKARDRRVRRAAGAVG